ncbi:MAG: hypothetical protein ABSA45_09625, partial [Verrucomicrobiota bacterium]
RLRWGARAPRVPFSAPFRGAPKRASATAARNIQRAPEVLGFQAGVAREKAGGPSSITLRSVDESCPATPGTGVLPPTSVFG